MSSYLSYYLLLGNFLYLIIFILGLVVGSFINAWVWRTRENFRIISGRSMCPTCHRKLRWFENIPVVSFIFLKGRCRGCRRPIPKHYAFVELATGFVFLLVTWYSMQNHAGGYLFFLRNLIFSVFLIIVFVYDWLYQEIVSDIVWFGSLVGVSFNYYLKDDFSLYLVAVAVAGGFFLLQFVISKGRWIGGGDVRLGVMMGLWLGWPYILAALFIAYITGAIWSLFLLLIRKKTLQSATPFGTHLALATFICLLWGPNLVNWYMQFLQ